MLKGVPVSKHYAFKMYMGSGDKAPIIIKPWNWMVMSD
jgi:hypothetical protein